MNDTEIARAFGAALRAARQARGLSQEALAEGAEVDRTYPSLLERGHRIPTLTVFLRLCRALHCAPADLIRAAHRTGCAGAHTAEPTHRLDTVPPAGLPPAGPP